MEPTEILKNEQELNIKRSEYIENKKLLLILSDTKVFFRIERILSKTFLKKTIRAQKVHTQLYSFFLYRSIIIIELLSTSIRIELQFLTFPEMGKFHTLALNFKFWPFSAIVTRHFRPNLSQSNERKYCKLMDRTSNSLFINTTKQNWVKETSKTCKKTLKTFSLKNKFPQSSESIKMYSSENNDLW